MKMQAGRLRYSGIALSDGPVKSMLRPEFSYVAHNQGLPA
jgi:hypothetical protein